MTMMIVFHILLLVLPVLLAQEEKNFGRSCPSFGGEADYVVWQNNGYHCHKTVKEFPRRATWSEAQEFCKTTYGGRLASIGNMHDNKRLMSLMQENGGGTDTFWVGAMYSKSKSSYINTKNMEQMYFNWVEAFNPKDIDNDGKCISVNRNTGEWFAETCAIKKYNYACEIDAPSSPVICPEGWLRVGTFCLSAIQSTPQTWSNARLNCQGLGGDLVNIKDVDGHIGIRSFCRSKACWIGHSDSVTEGQFRYSVDGSLVPKVNDLYWGPNQPDNSNDGSDCVFQQNEKWFTADCNQKHSFVCQQNAAPAKLQCPSGWKLIGEDCAQTIPHDSHKMSYHDAQATCKERGGHLFHVKNSLQNDGLVYHFGEGKHGAFWIGVNDNASAGDYRYTDNTKAEFTNLDSQDRNPEDRCVMVYCNGKWEHDSCQSKRHFICQRKADVVAA